MFSDEAIYKHQNMRYRSSVISSRKVVGSSPDEIFLIGPGVD
jgi:hypothetical protein